MFDRPVSAVPAQRSSTALLKLKLYAIIGAAGFAALMGLMAFVSWIAFTPDVPEVEDLLPSGSAYAEVVARDYLAGRTTQVPVAAEVDPTFGIDTFSDIDAGARKAIAFTSLTPLRVDRRSLSSADGVQDYEVHTYVVATSSRLLQLDVPLLLTPEGPVLAAQPSLLPVAPVVQEYLPLDYRQFASDESPSQQLRDQIAAWANAFARGDAAALRTVAGDQVTTGVYQGLGGFRVGQAPQVLTIVPFGSGDDRAIRVRLLLVDASAQEVQVSAEYDLLAQDVTSALPKVVAWGPAGTTDLEPYMNVTTDPASADTP